MNKLPLLVVLAQLLSGQQGGFISGLVRDRSGGAVAAAEVRVQSQETGARQAMHTDSGGHYATSELAPGSYKVTVRSDGFRTLTQPDIRVTAGKTEHADFTVELLPLQQEVTVSAARSDVDPTASGLTVSRETTAASLPQNGRDVHALFALMPGATITPASISAGGQFTVSGQRPNANSFRVDGVNANVGVGIVSVPGSLPGEALPGMSTLGGMQSLASKEETETVELRTEEFDAQFGDRPGAQINIETRAGTNDFHGSAFGYLRPRLLNSQDWFARGSGLDLPSAYLDGWGGGVGGPLRRNRTFFFAALERADLHDDALQIIAVPSAAARNNPRLHPYLPLFDAFPAPTGRALNTNESVGYSPLQKAGAVTNRSVRLDHEMTSHIHAFSRYSDVPSSSTSVELGSAYSAFRWISATGGIDYAQGRLTEQLRLNFTQVSADSQHGAQDPTAVNRLVVATGDTDFNDWSFAQVSMAGVGRTLSGAAGKDEQRQYLGSYASSWQSARHNFRFGGDYLQFGSNYSVNSHGLTLPSSPLGGFYVGYFSTASIVSPGIEALLNGVPLGLTSSVGAVPDATRQRYSSFAEDTFRVTDRLSVLVGLRWDATPTSLGAVFGYAPGSFAVGYWGGVGNAAVAISSNPESPASPWPTIFTQIAPRIGLAYHIKSPDLVFRAGTGLFYDTGLGSLITNTNPLTIWQYQPTSATPVSPAGTPPSADSLLSLPQVWEWKASLEKSISEQSLLSLSYIGSSGTKLLRNEATVDRQSNILQSIEFTSRGTSNYNALLATLRANITPNLYALASYTWGHSIDTGSGDTSPLLANGPSNKGSSSFDVRQVLTASFGYRTPSTFGRALGGWTLSSTSLARAGFPFDVTTVDQSIGLGFDNSDHANLVPGQPIWSANPTAPGGRQLNPAAFQTPPPGTSGSLGRNALTGPGLFQIDASVRRQVRLYRGLSAEASVSAFNLFNHAAFATPVSYLGSALFGQSTSMTNLMLGSGSPTTGLTPLFQAGGPRTIELSLRFSF